MVRRHHGRARCHRVGGADAQAAPRAAASERPDARPNPVIVWDIHAQNAIFEVARQPPTTASRSFAIVQGAVYDAVNTIAGTPYEPYLVAPHSRRGDSTPAAVATAAYRVLLWMFPAQADALGAQYAETLAAIPDGRAKDGGIAVGEATSAAMIEARLDDGAFDPGRTWPVGTDPGVWRPTPPNLLQTGGWFATLEPFVVRDAGAYRTPGPPPLASAAYARDQREVQRIGSATSTARTRGQTEAWTGNGSARSSRATSSTTRSAVTATDPGGIAMRPWRRTAVAMTGDGVIARREDCAGSIIGRWESR
jgi:hypothetical protein